MPGDLIRPVRRAVLARLKADAALTALVPAAAFFPGTTPAERPWPFGRMDGFSSTPLDGFCMAGATVSFLVHFFARGREQGGVEIETAEDHASRIGSAAKLALHNRRLAIDGGGSALVRVRSSRLLQDAEEGGAYHCVLACEARALAD